MHDDAQAARKNADAILQPKDMTKRSIEGPTSPEGVELRPVSESDLPRFYEHQLDPEAARMAAFTSRDHDAFTAHWRRIMTDDTVILRTIVVDGAVAGNIVSWEQDGIREVGYWIDKALWATGVATRALALYLDLVPIRPLHAHVAAHNVGSIRVLEKCGFTVSDRQTTDTEALDLELE